MKPVKLGIIGCGVIGQIHLEAARESSIIDVVAVADLREDVVRRTAEKFDIGKIYTDGDALLAEREVEAVVLALPTCVRTNLGLHALARGKHILIEKPVAMNADEVKQLIWAKGALVAGCCSSRYRLLESYDTVTDFIAGGALGKLRVIRCRAIESAGKPPTSTPIAWRLKRSLNGGGILVNWGCYDMDYLLGITGWSLKPKLVLAQTWCVPPQFYSYVAPGSDAETHFAAIVCCEGGTIMTLERGEYVSAQSEEVWQVVGTRGSLSLQMTPSNDKKIIYDDATTDQGVVSRVIWQGNEDVKQIFTALLQDFATAIREHRQPKTSLEHALIVQKITDAIYTSSEQGRAVEIEREL